jgi:GLPGLI family protein
MIKAQTDTVLTNSSNTTPIGKVAYLQQINLSAENYLNGTAVLLFNAAVSEYIHLGVAPQSTREQIDEFNSVNIPGDPEGFPVYKSHSAKKMWSKIPCYLSKQHCLVEDTLGGINWKIDPAEKKAFGTYECRKATGQFGGRTYEAWFTPDIPVGSGPYKLGGLPGLILEARSLDGAVQFSFIKLDMSANTGGEIRMPAGKDIDMDYPSFIKARDEYCKNLEKQFRAAGNDVSITPDKNTIELIEDTGN